MASKTPGSRRSDVEVQTQAIQTELQAQTSLDRSFPSIVCRLGERNFALSAGLVESMVQLPSVTRVPNTPSYIRGVMNLRGRILRVVDLRLCLSLPTLEEEASAFEQLMDDRLADHHSWLGELEASVREKRPFTMEADPERSKLGRFLSSFRTDDVLMRTLLTRFDRPHRAIHSIASRVGTLVSGKKYEEAERLVRLTRGGELAQITHLFSVTKDAYRRSRREIALVLFDGRVRSAAVVDQVLSVEHLEPLDSDHDDCSEMPSVGNSEHILGIMKRPRTEELVMLLLPSIVFDV